MDTIRAFGWIYYRTLNIILVVNNRISGSIFLGNSLSENDKSFWIQCMARILSTYEMKNILSYALQNPGWLLGLEIFMAMKIQVLFFWFVTPC
jgi:hypothetical protein